MYRVYFLTKDDWQGWADVEADSREEAIEKANLEKGETLLTVEEL